MLFALLPSIKSQITNTCSYKVIPIKLGIYNHDQSLRFEKNDTLEIYQTEKEHIYSYKNGFKNIFIELSKDDSIRLYDNINDFFISDTVYLEVFEDKIKVFKFEYIKPDIDGEVCVLANPQYGIIGYRSYTWGLNVILLNWNQMKTDIYLANSIFLDSLLIPKKIDLSTGQKIYLDSLFKALELDESIFE